MYACYASEVSYLTSRIPNRGTSGAPRRSRLEPSRRGGTRTCSRNRIRWGTRMWFGMPQLLRPCTPQGRRRGTAGRGSPAGIRRNGSCAGWPPRSRRRPRWAGPRRAWVHRDRCQPPKSWSSAPLKTLTAPAFTTTSQLRTRNKFHLRAGSMKTWLLQVRTKFKNLKFNILWKMWLKMKLSLSQTIIICKGEAREIDKITCLLLKVKMKLNELKIIFTRK